MLEIVLDTPCQAAASAGIEHELGTVASPLCGITNVGIRTCTEFTAGVADCSAAEMNSKQIFQAIQYF